MFTTDRVKFIALYLFPFDVVGRSISRVHLNSIRFSRSASFEFEKKKKRKEKKVISLSPTRLKYVAARMITRLPGESVHALKAQGLTYIVPLKSE